MDSVRTDKWLWAARFFKTRALAAKACELGRIDARRGEGASTPANRFAGNPGTWQPVKASREVHPGEMLRVKNDSGEFVIEVLGLSDVRGPAAVAQGLYRETEESKTARAAVVDARKAMPVYERTWESGRPTKRDRRVMTKLRGR
jgi:ribosome-associated heat shock protein Hsp15